MIEYQGERFYLFNAHGDVVQLTNAQGIVNRNYYYDAFGNEIASTSPPRYTGGPAFDSTSGIYTNDFDAAFHNADRYFTHRPDTGEYVETLELKAPSAQAFSKWIWKQLTAGAIYILEFGYWTDNPGAEFVYGLYGGLTGAWMNAGTVTSGATVQRAKIELSSNHPEMVQAGIFFAYYQNNGSVYLTNVRFYNKATVEAGPDTTPDNNPFRFCGEYWDSETGTYYLRARFYDPQNGRFTSEDPIRDGLNYYTYAINNPIMYFDPLGLSELFIKLREEVERRIGWEWVSGGSISWDSKQRAATVILFNNSFATRWVFTEGVDGTHIKSDGLMYVKESTFNSVFRAVTQEPGIKATNSRDVIAYFLETMPITHYIQAAVGKDFYGNSLSTEQRAEKMSSGFEVSMGALERTYMMGGLRMTTPQATSAANSLGYRKTNFTSHGQPVYERVSGNGPKFITPDVDSHSGGIWKGANSVSGLGSKTTRSGTFSSMLQRIGD